MKISYKAAFVTGLVAVSALGTVSAVGTINQNHQVAKAGNIPFATGPTKIVPNVTPQKSADSSILQGSDYQVQTPASTQNQFYGAQIR